jgi:hypothetical protein
MNMRVNATNRTAAAVGAASGLLLFFAAPVIDAPDRAASVWLVLCAVGTGIPAYFYVLGVSEEDRQGLWVLNPAVLKRAGSFLLAAGAAIVLAIGCSSIVRHVQVDRCLDSGGRWNEEARACER